MRKKFTLKASDFLKFEWIEGIGSLNGLFYCSHVAIPTKSIDQNEYVKQIADTLFKDETQTFVIIEMEY